MKTHPKFRKIAAGVVTNREMYALFRRYDGSPFNETRLSGALWAGEWFEIEEASYDYMLGLIPPLFQRGGLFGMSEYLAGDVTQVYCRVIIQGQERWFVGYCDVSVVNAPELLRNAIIARETAPDANEPRRDEKLEIIWNATHPDFKGYAGSFRPEAWREEDRGKRSIMFNGGGAGTCLGLLEDLTDAQIEEKFRLRRIYVPAQTD